MTALAYSDNIYAVKTHLFLGEENLVNMLERVGITKNIDAIAGDQEQNQCNADACECLQHIATALQCTKFHHLGAACFVGAFFCFQGHCGKADRKAMVGNNLHQPVIYKGKA